MREKPDGISVAITGGLGNQLFQLANGISLSRRLNSRLELFHQEFIGATARSFQLDFARNIPGVEVIAEKKPLRVTYVQARWGYSEEVNALMPGTHLEGTFQSWRHAAPALADIRAGLEKDGEFLQGVKSAGPTQFLACHIRRGDYLKNPARRHHGITKLAYHVVGVKKLRNELGIPRVILFSESKLNAWPLRLLFGTGVEIAPEGSPLFTLGIMSSASAWVISNSSFSWWAAFLGGGTSARVIAPDSWFDSKQVDMSNLMPWSWETRPGALRGNLRARIRQRVKSYFGI